MSSFIYLAGFVVIWVATFIPAWRLLLKLLALSVSEKPLTKKFITYFLLYRLVIAAPYIFLIIFGKDLPDLLINTIWGIIILSVLLSIARFFFKNRIVPVLWRTYSHVYDGLLNFYPYTNLLRIVAERIGKDDIEILDAGCGTGNFISLINTSSNRHILGIDADAGMVTKARKKLKNYSSVQIRQKNITKFLSSSHQKFDIIVAVNVLYAIDNRKLFWEEALDHLNAGGKIIVTNSDRGGSWPIIKEHLQNASLLHLFRPSLLIVFLIDSFISQLASTGKFSFLKIDDIQSEVTAAGGKISDVIRCYGGAKDGVNLLFTVSK